MQTAAHPLDERAGIPPEMLTGLKWRLVGPHRGGRVVAVAGDPSNPLVFYFGACDGGVWKTTDAGLTWRNVSDGFFKMAAVGALAVAESDPNVIYAGMGETTIRGDVSHGDGVYRSTDAGKTWLHLGLEDTQAIAKIRVHPKNADIVYVAALGHIWGPNDERGVYRSTDGGATWEKILFRSDRAGAIDLSMDPNNPRILYAAFWEAQRTPWSLISGGPGSSLYRSTDGGDTWTEITRNEGLPKGLLGKIGVTVSPARQDRVWAIIEAEEKGGVYRSDDGGETWRLLTEDTELRQRPWYYMHIFADPVDAQTVYVLNLNIWKSTDGGTNYVQIPTPHGDTHDLWIDPSNPRRMINGNDGGACVSLNGGETWSSIYNQPTAQFYHVVTDNQVPYRLYGAQQDNTTLSVPSRSDTGAITIGDCYPVGGGESGYIAVRPDDPNIVYAGSYGGLLTRYDHRTRQIRNITVWPENPMGWPAKALKYRFQWTFPIVLSPHDPSVLYATGNHVFRTTDEGTTWEEISPDLTRNDVTKMEDSGGPITRDNTSVEYYGTIFAFAESPVAPGVFWAGSDDGLIHLSRDGGQTWTNVTPPDLPEWALISILEPSPHDAATAYVAATRYKLDDFAPYLYKTTDYGQTWTKITNGIPEHDFTRVIREDPTRRGLLYAGTETGVYVSFDDGAHWQRLQLNLPVAPIHDLAVHGKDLIAATHGRSFWILDDLTPIREFQPGILEERAHLFSPGTVIRFRGGLRRFRSDEHNRLNYQSTGAQVVTSYRLGKDETIFLDAGMNPPDGATIYFYLKDKPDGEVSLAFLDANGNEIKRFSSERPDGEAAESGPTNSHAPKKKQEPRVPKEAGLNRFIWNLRYPDAEEVVGAVLWAGSIDGPLAPPGRYQVRLSVDGETYTQSFDLVKDPRVPASDEDLREQFDLLIKIRDKLSEAHRGIKQIRAVRPQIEEWAKRAEARDHAPIAEEAEHLRSQLTEVEEELIQVRSKSLEDPLNYPIKLNNKLAALAGVVAAGDAAPTVQSYDVFNTLAAAVDEQIGRLSQLLESDLPRLNRLVKESELPAVDPQLSGSPK